MIRRFLPALAALALLAGACGGDDDDAVDDAPSDDTAETEPDDAGDAGEDGDASDAGAASVTIQDFAFDPASIEVEAGTTVTWTNEDGVTHTVTSGTPGAADGTFDETADSGATVEIDFDDPGTFAYFCAIHPSMTGEVVVS